MKENVREFLEKHGMAGNTPCYFPEDAFAILLSYIEQRKDKEYLFYNSIGNQLNSMYFSRMMEKYTEKAGIQSCSAESLRNTCAVTMLYAYGTDSKQVALQMGVTQMRVKRYKNMAYKENLMRMADRLVKIKIELPDLERLM